MVNTRANASHSEPIMSTTDQISQQLTTIAAKLEAMDALAADVAALKTQNSQNQRRKSKVSPEEGEVDITWKHQETYRRPHTKMEFPKYEGEILEIFLLGSTVRERSITGMSWFKLCKKITDQNPDEHLCGIQSVFEYRQEFAKRAARVQNWPERCLLGVFLSGLKEDLRVDVRIHKPRSVYKAMSLALEYEGKHGTNQSSKVTDWPSISRPSSIGTSSPMVQESFNFQSSRQPVRSFQQSSLPNICPLNSEQQIRREKGLCYRCGDKFAPGHCCKPRTFASLELMQEENTESFFSLEDKAIFQGECIDKTAALTYEDNVT
ncbi:hypothetical protein CQW23_24838 [Capsicum baccatum]|uniref:Retrotransposon gag domain-containing protein n=1 Tax=Capsicum baccatum TaxID=33114 RepID=A0A2G2VVX9_CAPBA|nr:hypothetical protein CQW23_24838 [Capsicum baccatum]